MTDSYKDIKISQVFDPRCSVSNTILGSDSSNVNFIINRCSDNIQYFNYTADSTSRGQIAFNNITIDPNVGLGSLLIVTTPVTVFVKTDAGGSAPGPSPTVGYAQNDGIAPRPSLFMKNSANVTLGLNSCTMTESTRYYLHALAHYGYNYDEMIDMFSITMRSCLDNDTTYDTNANNNVLAEYKTMPAGNAIMTRGAYKDIQWTISNGDAAGFYVHILFTDIVPVSPLNIADKPKYCIPGVNNLTLQINMSPEVRDLISLSSLTLVGAGLPAANQVNVNLSACQVWIGQNAPGITNPYGTQAKLWYQLYNIPPELTDGIMPSLRNYIYPFYSTNSFINSSQQTLTGGGNSFSMTSNSVTPSGVPKYIYIWAELNDLSRDPSMPYWFFAPKQLTVNFLNKQNSLTSIIPIEGQRCNTQLFTLIAAKNGYRGCLAQFKKCAVICLTPEDLNLDSGLLTGMIQQSSLTVTYEVYDNVAVNPAPSTVDLHITLVYEGALTYQGGSGGGMFNIMNNIVNPALLQNAEILQSKDYYINNADRDYLGGFSMKQLFNSAKGVARSVVKGVQTAAPYIQKGAEAVTKYAPAALAALGAGSGGGFVAGQQLGRKYLRDRL